ncbi:glycosyl hydrolase, partial [Helicosporidium sp. ATCC 50920]
AAALAAAALLWQNEDPDWSAEALEKAKALWVLATTKPKSYRDSPDGVIKNMQSLYATDGHYADELAWAAAWLALATQNDTYAEAMAEWTERQEQHNTLETWQYSPATNVLQASKFGESMTEHNAMYNAQQFFDRYLDGSIGRTDRGAAYPYHWTAMQHVGNLAFLGQVHAKNERFVDPSYRARVFNYARFQADYTLGSAGRSWLTGFGKDYPEYLWHKASYFSPQNWTPEDGERIWMGEDRGPWTTKVRGNDKMVQRAQFAMQNSQEPQRHVAYGALFGAPLQDDGMINTRKDYTYAEPTTVANAAITGAYAGLAEYYGLGTYDDAQLLEVMHVDYDALILQLSHA